MYKIAAHRGNHSKNGKGLIKVAILKLLEGKRYNFFNYEEHGNFLVRIQKQSGARKPPAAGPFLLVENDKLVGPNNRFQNETLFASAPTKSYSYRT